MGKINIKYMIMFVASCILTIESCTKLEENVYDKLIAEETELKAEDLSNLIAPAYVAFRDAYIGWDALPYAMEESSDCMVVPVRIGIGWGDYYVAMHMHQWTGETWHVEGQWSFQYDVVNTCNKALYQLESIENVDDVYKYELRALRATAYYILLDFYRNVPIVTEWDVPDGYLPEQNTATEVYNFIESELVEAMPYLLEGNDETTYGRFTIWAAKMTLAKLYLNSVVYGQQARYDDALIQVNDIINSGLFERADNYLDPFKAENEGSVEEILTIPLDEVYASFYAYPNKTLNNASGKTFNMSMELWGGTGMIPQFINTFDPDDERLEMFLGGPQYTYAGDPLLLDDGSQLDYTNYMTEVEGCYPFEGWRCVKYELSSGLTGNPGNDIPYYRYTDALMIKAECLLRTGHADEAATIVTSIRQRAFKNNPAKATVTGTELQEGSSYEYGNLEGSVMTNYQGGSDIQYGRFLDELGWEFVFEAHRKQDLIRFGVYTTKRWFSHVPNGDYRAIYPIPQSQLETNPNLTQNPGY